MPKLPRNITPALRAHKEAPPAAIMYILAVLVGIPDALLGREEVPPVGHLLRPGPELERGVVGEKIRKGERAARIEGRARPPAALGGEMFPLSLLLPLWGFMSPVPVQCGGTEPEPTVSFGGELFFGWVECG